MNPRIAARVARGVLIALGVAAVCVGGGCERVPGGGGTPAPEASSPTPTETYEVRGEIVSVPTAGSPLSELQIRHEHIPEFIDFEGENPVGADGVRGMRAMTMPFPVHDRSMLEGYGAGDKVLLTFAVDRVSRSYWLTGLEKLPPETELDYSPKAP